MAAVLSQASAEEGQVQHAPLYEQAPIQEPQHEREMSVGVSARTPSAEPGTQQALQASQGKGGRPKSSVWKHFTTEGKREDKSKREDVRCRFCNVVMPGRAEGMEKHIAQDCQSVQDAAKQEMMQLMMTKKMQNLEKKGLKRRAEAAVEASNPGLLENAHSGYALPEPHHRSSYGALLHAAEAAHNSEPQHMLQHAPQDAIVQAAPALAPPQPAAPLDPQICLQQILHGQAEIRAKLDNVPRRLRNSRATTGEALLRPLCREKYAANGPAPGAMPPPGLFPSTWREALRTDSYRVDMLVEFYGDTFGITGHDQLEDKQSKFLEWIGAVRP